MTIDATVSRSSTRTWKLEMSRTLPRTPCVPAESVLRNEGQCDECNDREVTDLQRRQFYPTGTEDQTDHVAALFSFPKRPIKISGKIVGITK